MWRRRFRSIFDAAPRRRQAPAAVLLALSIALVGSGCRSNAWDVQQPQSIVSFMRDWYERADPAICDRLTDALLESGWGAIGDAGRQACRTGVEQAEPVRDVVVQEPVREGNGAAAVVIYTTGGERAADRVHFEMVGGTWFADRLARLREVPETSD